MNDDNPLLTLFEELLKDKEEKQLIEAIIKEKSKEEIIEQFSRKSKK